MTRSTPRFYGLASLVLLGAYAAAILVASRTLGRPFDAVEPWPLGGGAGDPGSWARSASLVLGLALGWAVPGLSLAALSDPRTRGAALLARGLGLGVGYLLLTSLAFGIASGHAPGRAALLVLLALPPVAATLRGGGEGAPPQWTAAAAIVLVALVAIVFWPKLHDEGMNGDGTEAYELAQSLDAHPVQRWDMERWDPPGRFGTPAVNPMITYASLAHGEMALLGRSELAVRLPFVPALVLSALLASGLVTRLGRSGAVYVAAVVALEALWNAYYCGWEPAFTDLAEPAATDLTMTALWLAGFGQVLAGSAVLGTAFLVLASGVLYSAPVLACAALTALAWAGELSGRRAFGVGLAAGACALAAALAYGWAVGDLGDWLRQVRSEYVLDFVDTARRIPSFPLLGRFVLATGALPFVAAVRWARLSPASRALLASSAVYAALVFVGSVKNLHYLTPLPFLLAPPALEAAGTRARAIAVGLLAAAFALSWPQPAGAHRENQDLGRVSCVGELSYEQACLNGGVLYDAFDRPGRHGGRFAVGKHTFVRYALALGGERECAIRLSPTAPDGWIAVAGDGPVVSTRDPDAYAAWRFRAVPAPSSWLFAREAPAGFRADDRIVEGPAHGRARLLVPPRAGRLVLSLMSGGGAVRLVVNGQPLPEIAAPAGRSELSLETAAPPWRRGWNVVEVRAPENFALETIP